MSFPNYGAIAVRSEAQWHLIPELDLEITTTEKELSAAQQRRCLLSCAKVGCRALTCLVCCFSGTCACNLNASVITYGSSLLGFGSFTIDTLSLCFCTDCIFFGPTCLETTLCCFDSCDNKSCSDFCYCKNCSNFYQSMKQEVSKKLSSHGWTSQMCCCHSKDNVCYTDQLCSLPQETRRGPLPCLPELIPACPWQTGLEEELVMQKLAALRDRKSIIKSILGTSRSGGIDPIRHLVFKDFLPLVITPPPILEMFLQQPHPKRPGMHCLF